MVRVGFCLLLVGGPQGFSFGHVKYEISNSRETVLATSSTKMYLISL